MSGLLLDTHSLLWWVNKPHLLSSKAFDAIEENADRVLVSSVSAYELAFKHRLGKLDEAGPLLESFTTWFDRAGFERLETRHEHALMAGGLDPRHRDPFDRLLIAQALIEGVELVSNEELFDGFGVRRLW